MGASLRAAPQGSRSVCTLPLLLLGLLLSAAAPSAHAALRVFRLSVFTKVVNADCQKNVSVATINGRFPGPTLTVVEGDTLRIHVTNHLKVGVTLHWHGIRQFGTPWADGPAGVTQCPLPPTRSMTYTFTVARQRGLFWYHAHVSMLRGTLLGALIVLPKPGSIYPAPALPKFAGNLLFELQDWYHQTASELRAGVEAKPPTWPGADALLINGKGTCKRATYVVVPGRTYHVRIVQQALYAQVNFRIQGHVLTVFRTDGEFIKPFRTNSLDIISGQTWELYFTANRPAGAYWIVSSGRYEGNEFIPEARARLRYSTAPTTAVPRGAPPPSPITSNYSTLQEKRLKAFVPLPKELRRRPDRIIVLQWTQVVYQKKSLLVAINNVTLAPGALQTPILYLDYKGVALPYDLPDKPPPTPKTGGLKYVKFGAPIYEIKQGAWVQLVLQNHPTLNLNHPWHLHGFNFYVVARGTGVFNASAPMSYRYNLVDPVYRNTVTAYADEWVAIRVLFSKPGVWIMHCHHEPHVDQGMLLLFHVKAVSGSELPAPPADSPKCGIWK